MDKNLSPILRVVLLGPESSGKTTLAALVARAFQTWVVPEYFRFWWEARRFSQDAALWTVEDFRELAVAQVALEETLATRVNGLLVCDTDAFNLSFYSLRYLGLRPKDRVFQPRRGAQDLIYVCSPVAFEDDGFRDREELRQPFLDAMLGVLTAEAIPFSVLKGDLNDRFAQVEAQIHARISTLPGLE